MLGRFISADTLVPGAGNPQAFNRYAYGLNNPVKYTDPSGHYVYEDDPNEGLIYDSSRVKKVYGTDVRLRESDSSWTRDAGHQPTDAELAGTFLGVPAIATLSAVFGTAEFAARGIYGVAGNLLGTVTSNLFGGKDDLLYGLNAEDMTLSYIGGGLSFGQSPLVSGGIVGGQYIAKQILNGDEVKLLDAGVNAALATSSSWLASSTSGLTAGLPQTAKSIADNVVVPMLTDNAVNEAATVASRPIVIPLPCFPWTLMPLIKSIAHY